MNRYVRQFFLFVWKHFLHQKRNLFWTNMEIMLPATFPILLMSVVRSLSPVHEVTNSTRWDDFGIENRLPLSLGPLAECRLPGNPAEQFVLAHVPNNTAMFQLMDKINTRISDQMGVMGFDTEAELEEYMRDADNCSRSRVLAAIVMTSTFTSSDQFPSNVTYKLRPLPEKRISTLAQTSLAGWSTDISFQEFSLTGPRGLGLPRGGLPGYYSQGFLSLQKAIDLSLILMHDDTVEQDLDNIDINLKRHPYPPYRDDGFIQVLGTQLPLLAMFSMLLVLPNLTKEICLEKERKQKELMSLYGASTFVAAMARFLRYSTLYLLASGIITLFMFVPTSSKGAMVNYSAPSLFFVFILAYAGAQIMFAFAVSTIFKSAIGGGAATGILHLLTYIPWFYIQFHIGDISAVVRAGTSVFPNMAASYGLHAMGVMEGRGAGADWHNFDIPLTPEANFTILHASLFLLLDLIMYAVIAWYLEAVLPRHHGIPKPWYFPLSKECWCRSSYKKKNGGVMNFKYQGDNFEASEAGLRAGIQIRNLKKVYKKKDRAAVSGFNLDIFENQITVLVGGNGCGKSSVIDMVSGFTRPSSGSIYIHGYDTDSNMVNARASLGVSFQEDILFGDLTVKEHLTFYAKLKGMSEHITDEIERFIKSLKLEGKRDFKVRDLSLAQQRKLSVAIALVAGSKCVLLDAPTSGMDPIAQRQVWELLRQEKKHRTILMTTQSIEEADSLADRLVIMAAGTVHACGTTKFLKHQFGNGHSLSLMTSPRCDTADVIKTVQSLAPSASVQFNMGRELAFSLPQVTFDQLHHLLSHVETNKVALDIRAIRASTPTLDDVMCTVRQMTDSGMSMVGSDKHSQVGRSVSDVSVSVENSNTKLVTSVGSMTKNRGNTLAFQQFNAILSQRVTISGRNLGHVLMHMLLAVVFVVAGCGVAHKPMKPLELPPYPLTVDKFHKPVSPYHLMNDTGTSPSIIQTLSEKYLQVLSSTKVKDAPRVDGSIDMDDFLEEKADANFDEYLRNHMTAATFEDGLTRTNVIGHFNNEAFHTPAISLNLITNTLMKYFIGDSYGIQVTNHPLPRESSIEYEDPPNLNSIETLTFSFCVSFGFVFLTSSFTTLLVKERKNKSKHRQLVTGLGVGDYWAPTFIWDYFLFMICGGLATCVMVAFQLDGFSTGEGVGVVISGFLLYGWASISLGYALAFLFDIPGSAYVWITSFNHLTSTSLLIAVSILATPVLEQERAAEILEWILLSILPHFAFQNIMHDLTSNYQNRELCTSLVPDTNMTRTEMCELNPNITSRCCPATCGEQCAPYQDSLFSFHKPGAGRCLTFLAVQGLLHFILLANLESNLLYKIRQKISNKEKKDIDEDDDEDAEKAKQEKARKAKAEKLRAGSNEVMVTQNLTKYYGMSAKAVNNLSVRLSAGEVLGLLGVNGAGKTALLRMLTGDETLTMGQALVSGIDIKKSSKRTLGYSQQLDDSTEQMTVFELLRLYARLHGVKKKQISRVIDAILDNLNLTRHAKKEARHLSAGDRRMLSVASALIGRPSLVLLDDPTRDIESLRKHLIWDAISNTCTAGDAAVVVTSRSVDDCELFSDRLLSLMNGHTRVLDTLADINTTYVDGYTLVAKVQTPDVTKIDGAVAKTTETKTKLLKRYIKTSIPGAVLKGQHLASGLVIYKINTDLTLADVLDKMEKSKQRYHVGDYTISDLSLEQVFLKGFVKPLKIKPDDSDDEIVRKDKNKVGSVRIRSDTGEKITFENITTKADAKSNIKSHAKSNIKHNTKSDVKSESKDDIKTDTKSDIKRDTKIDSDADTSLKQKVDVAAQDAAKHDSVSPTDDDKVGEHGLTEASIQISHSDSVYVNVDAAGDNQGSDIEEITSF